MRSNAEQRSDYENVRKTCRTVGASFPVCAANACGGTARGGREGVRSVGTNDEDVTVSSPLLIEGTLRKVGDGTLTVPLSNVFSADGRIEVLDGQLNLTADSGGLTADIPTDILAKAAFWVDANKNVVVSTTNLVACYTNGEEVVHVTNTFDNAVARVDLVTGTTPAEWQEGKLNLRLAPYQFRSFCLKNGKD